jgi:colicin import membrane protein
MLRNANEEAEARRKHDQQREQALIEAERQAARAEAQRLADEALQQKAEMERKAEEERRAEAARLQREVEEQRIAEEKRLHDERRIAAEKKAEDERQAEAARAARETEERRVAEAKRRAEEKRKAEEARIAEVKRQAEEAEAKRKAEEARVAEQKRREEEARVAEESRRAAEEAHLAEQRRIKEFEDAQQRTALELQREKEAEAIAEKFRLAREAREREKETRSTLGGPMPEHELPSPFLEPPATAQATYPQRVTVLVVMQPRRHGFGGRRMTANPVLCVGQECYVSNGAGSPATVMQRARALGPGNTLGRNAGACRNQTTCVFRGIVLSGLMSTIQPVDMGFLRHDRRETRTIEPDRSCDASGGALYCSAPIVSTGYRAWIIPESVADKAGALVLERALDDGLPAGRSASYGGGWDSTVQALPTR